MESSQNIHQQENTENGKSTTQISLMISNDGISPVKCIRFFFFEIVKLALLALNAYGEDDKNKFIKKSYLEREYNREPPPF